uniref:(northern house mosquito) hypothetical protein n=1 Tax=Culex pipiens TaxID=7175 RepID=A0A8D8F7I9_CULPI
MFSSTVKIKHLHRISQLTSLIKFQCHRSIDELRKNIEPSVLPEEYGGTVPLAKLNENFKKYLLSKRDMLLALDRMEIVLGCGSSADPAHGGKDIVDAGAVGSFRKLQID